MLDESNKSISNLQSGIWDRDKQIREQKEWIDRLLEFTELSKSEIKEVIERDRKRAEDDEFKRFFLGIINASDNEADVTDKYKDMLERFANDFQLAKDGKSLSSLQEHINDREGLLFKDVELLNELAYHIRNGKMKIKQYNRKDRNYE
jgi:hypothetical protein